MQTQPIALYDSGVGGLTVLQAFREQFPHENLVYFADTLNLPYGQKSPDQIIDYTRNIIQWFQNEMQAKMVIAACHTSSALALTNITHEFRVPVIGTIYPLLETFTAPQFPRRLGIIATPASADSRMHETIFRANGYAGDMLTIGCKDFVPLIESGVLHTPDVISVVSKTLQPFDTFRPDAVLLGCTHYPLLKPVFEKVLPSHIQYIDPAHSMVNQVRHWLQRNQASNSDQVLRDPRYFCSHQPEMFESKLRRILGMSNLQVQCVNPHL